MESNDEQVAKATTSTETRDTRWVSTFRPNVFLLFLMAYGLLALLYYLLIDNGCDGQEAFAFIENPLLVLLGGTVAVVKDLVH